MGRARMGRAGLGRPRGRIGIAWGVRSRPISDRTIRATVRAALAHGGREGIDVEVALVSDRHLAKIHGRFLGDPTPTDVISFDLGEDGDGLAAEIYVSVDRARAVARERRDPIVRELSLYLVHGALHLCGLDDRTEKDRTAMRAAEAAVLAALGHRVVPREHVRAGTRSPRVYKKTGKISRG